MKAIHPIWWSALAFASVFTSHTALAQMHQPTMPMPDQHAQSDITIPRETPGSNGTEESSGASSGAHSEAGMEYSQAPAAASHPKPQMQGDVTWLCGGIGEEEAGYMKSQARGYDMMLTFAAKDGSYLADVNVDIRDAKGAQVLQAKCDSPIMLIDVPKSGTYRIRADAAGYTLNRTAKVTAKQRKGAKLAAVVLTWPQQVAEGPVAVPADSSSGAGSDAKGRAGSAGDAGSGGEDKSAK